MIRALLPVSLAIFFTIFPVNSSAVKSHYPANKCGVTTSTPVEKRGQEPGLRPSDSCARPAAILEKNADMKSYPARGFENEAVRFPAMQAWMTFLQVVKPVGREARNFSFLNLPWKERKAVFSFQHHWIKVSRQTFHPQESRQQHIRLSGTELNNGRADSFCQMDSKDMVFFNETLSEFLRDNDLWHKAGVVRFLKNGKSIVMPKGSIKLKTSWVKTDSKEDIGNFITARDGKYQLWKLVSMHVATKQLPGWTWATFEHRNNPCFNRHLKAQDNFGYPSGPGSDYSEELLGMARQSSSDDDKFRTLVEIITNYRLVGAMTDYTDSYGRPVILGNSVTEAGFQTTSSCLTCHARAALDVSGKYHPDVFNKKQQSFNGAPQWEWFFKLIGSDELFQKYFQTDFMWSIPLCASADASGRTDC
ncbi:hypothetical protein [Parendozoicomonas sp. Alg238-R29]|uniref:hypothetical protein n=1 Tax=Parendozoicomonas sp. Alg238-R29 TaxID=2993446 RepID=UPI00248DAF2F|nr:hypothetical protein [Parendozoicomonas sp. Alg238-R29]